MTHVEAVADVDPCLDALAAAVGVERPAAEREAFRRLDAEQASRPAGVSRRSAFVPIWRRPWMTMNRRDVRRLGPRPPRPARRVRRCETDRYPAVELDDVAARHPDLVLLPSEPYPFRERHRADVASLGADVRFVDGQDLFWWGVRTPAAIDRLRQSIGA